MITGVEFKKHIAKAFCQEMRKFGFKGTGLKYFQETEEYLIAVYIKLGRWGAHCSTGFAIHPKQVKNNSIRQLNLLKLKIVQYKFKMSLTDYASGERWDYADGEIANLETLYKITDFIKAKAFPVIEQFKRKPDFLELFEVNEMDDFHKNWTRKTGTTIAITPIPFAWAMTLVFEDKNIIKAKAFAKWGLANLEIDEGDEKWFGEKDFDRVLAK